MSAISSNISHRQWGGSRQNYEQSDQDRRVQKLRAYLAKIKKALPEQIRHSYFFIDGRHEHQEYNDHFQRVFKECFVEVRGREALVEEASRGLIREFESIPDICQRSEIALYYDDDTGHTPTIVNRKIQPNL